GTFGEVSLAQQREEIDLNVGVLVELTHLFLPMLEQKRGGVINVASTAAFQPVPYMAVYGATKAFVLSFSEALWAEYRERGVRVLALCPGSTNTPFFDRIGRQAVVGELRRPDVLVDVALRAFDRNRSYVIDGFKNYWLAHGLRLVPRRTPLRVIASMMRPRPSLPSQGTGG
ncbi:MAG TPA: SDR family NAD(P)-dependent oxidoreductase, partial [Polyangiales bacterium]